MRRGQVYSDMPLITDSFNDLQVNWAKNFPGANIGIDYATNAIEKIGRIPEIVTVSIYNGTSYLRPGDGNPNTRYKKDIKIIDQLLKLGVKKIIVGNAGAEIRYNHLDKESNNSRIYKVSKFWNCLMWQERYFA